MRVWGGERGGKSGRVRDGGRHESRKKRKKNGQNDKKAGNRGECGEALGAFGVAGPHKAALVVIAEFAVKTCLLCVHIAPSSNMPNRPSSTFLCQFTKFTDDNEDMSTSIC